MVSIQRPFFFIFEHLNSNCWRFQRRSDCRRGTLVWNRSYGQHLMRVVKRKNQGKWYEHVDVSQAHVLKWCGWIHELVQPQNQAVVSMLGDFKRLDVDRFSDFLKHPKVGWIHGLRFYHQPRCCLRGVAWKCFCAKSHPYPLQSLLVSILQTTQYHIPHLPADLAPLWHVDWKRIWWLVCVWDDECAAILHQVGNLCSVVAMDPAWQLFSIGSSAGGRRSHH